MAIWTIEVDVCVTRPPCPDNIRTATVMLDMPAETHEDEWNAWLIATYFVWNTRLNVVMPTATRTIEVCI